MSRGRNAAWRVMRRKCQGNRFQGACGRSARHRGTERRWHGPAVSARASPASELGHVNRWERTEGSFRSKSCVQPRRRDLVISKGLRAFIPRSHCCGASRIDELVGQSWALAFWGQPRYPYIGALGKVQPRRLAFRKLRGGEGLSNGFMVVGGQALWPFRGLGGSAACPATVYVPREPEGSWRGFGHAIRLKERDHPDRSSGPDRPEQALLENQAERIADLPRR